ncbi:MAG: acyl carrier protein [Alistipes sp.]|nr:acyl carrier protein [Candidatus Minthomonas equi]
MTKEEILDRTKAILAVVKPAVKQDDITFDSVLVKDLGLDSLSNLLMGLALEREFGIKIDDEARFVTVNDVCEYILKSIS